MYYDLVFVIFIFIICQEAYKLFSSFGSFDWHQLRQSNIVK